MLLDIGQIAWIVVEGAIEVELLMEKRVLFDNAFAEQNTAKETRSNEEKIEKFHGREIIN